MTAEQEIQGQLWDRVESFSRLANYIRLDHSDNQSAQSFARQFEDLAGACAELARGQRRGIRHEAKGKP
jgi:hypothetical protein